MADTGPCILSLTDKSSPITTATVSLAGVSFSDVQSDNKNVYFSCSDPAKKGQAVVQSLSLQQDAPQPVTLSDQAHNVRSAVHEYGGGAFCVGPGGVGVIYTDFPSHTIYWKKSGSEQQQPAVQVFPAANTTSPCRMANFFVAEVANESFLIAVMEDHTDPAPDKVVNSLVRLSLDGSGKTQTLAKGKDFYASSSLCLETHRLAFVAWNHPNMPWDRTTAYVLQLDATSLLPTDDDEAASKPEAVHGHDAGGGLVSVYAPQWYKGHLYFLSDQTGYYNLYRWKSGTESQALYPQEADFSEGKCGWSLGCRCYTFLENGMLAAVYVPPKTDSADVQDGSRIVLLNTADLSVQEYGRSCLPPMSIDSLTACGSTLYFLGGSTTSPRGLWCWERPGDTSCVAKQVLSSMKSVDNLALLLQFFSEPVAIQFPSDCGVGHAYGYFYPPCNLSKNLPASFLPPLLVKAHGGPTARTSTTFRLDVQFWTSRGFAVLDVDYGGSTGYGKDYQQSLQGKWGLVDVDDVAKGAQYCVDEGWVNPDWLSIDGRSAGGYTTLAALAFQDIFQAGASLYGIGDLSALYTGTHKFESRYMDGLIGPYPDEKATYDERCPINFTGQLNCPVILLQGDEDKVVPPDQAETMFSVLTDKGLPSALVIYKGEQHGFRKSENISHALLSEYYFFCETFGIKPQAEKGFAGVAIGQRLEV